MMNSKSTSKIVVGVGLAAVFSIGVSVFALHSKHESQVAQNAPVATPLGPTAAQTPADATAPSQGANIQAPADQTAIASNATAAAAAPAIAPTPVVPTAPAPSSVAKSNAGVLASDEPKPAKSKAKARKSDDAASTRVASSNDMTSSSTAAVPAETPAAPSSEPVASDSRITAEVKSEIATAAPNSSVDVTTTDGVVALAGSAPSQDAVDQAKQAAQRVAGVKQVDSSALTINNQ